MPDLFKRTMLKICKALKKKVKKKMENPGGWGGGSTVDPLEWKFQGGGGV